jgi:hypothetical protein
LVPEKGSEVKQRTKVTQRRERLINPAAQAMFEGKKGSSHAAA